MRRPDSAALPERAPRWRSWSSPCELTTRSHPLNAPRARRKNSSAAAPKSTSSGTSPAAAAMELEKQSLGAQGAPTLGRAYELLRDQWKSGERERELALHLMFLAWYLMMEPPFLTGLDE